MRRLFYIALPLLLPLRAPAETYELKDKTNSTELVTPYGNKSLDFSPGDVSPDGNYQIVIPIDQLKPTPTPTPTPTPSPTPTPTPDPNAKNDKGAPNDKAPANATASPAASSVSSSLTSSTTANATPPMLPLTLAAPTPTPTPTRADTDYDDSDALVIEANHLYNKGKYYEASTVVDELLRKRPDHVRGWIMRGSLMKLLGQRELALTAWKKALELDPQNWEIGNLVRRLQ